MKVKDVVGFHSEVTLRDGGDKTPPKFSNATFSILANSPSIQVDLQLLSALSDRILEICEDD